MHDCNDSYDCKHSYRLTHVCAYSNYDLNHSTDDGYRYDYSVFTITHLAVIMGRTLGLLPTGRVPVCSVYTQVGHCLTGRRQKDNFVTASARKAQSRQSSAIVQVWQAR